MSRIAIIVPGILGSTLWHCTGQERLILWDSDFSANYKRFVAYASLLRWDGRRAEAELLETIRLSSVLPIYKNMWRGTLEWLEATKELGYLTSVIKFPYDWRASLLDTARHLRDALQLCVPADLASEPARQSEIRLTFITHSMGGLVARIAVGLELLHPAWIDRIVHLGTPLRGSPTAFQTAFGSSSLPFLGDFIGLVKGKNQETYFDALREAYKTFPSLYQLFPRAEEPFLYYDPLSRSNPLNETVIESRYREDALKAHNALDAADASFRNYGTRIDVIYTETHLTRRTELEYEVAVVQPSPRYSILNVHAASASGDGTVPAYSACRSEGTVHRHPVINVDHQFMSNSPMVTPLLRGLF